MVVSSWHNPGATRWAANTGGYLHQAWQLFYSLLEFLIISLLLHRQPPGRRLNPVFRQDRLSCRCHIIRIQICNLINIKIDSLVSTFVGQGYVLGKT